MSVLFVGDDWAEDHHDVEVVDETGPRLARRRLPEGVVEVEQLHALIADHLGDDAGPGEVVVGIKTDRGPWVQALLAAGYTVYAVNPLQAARYRDRHSVSRAKSDPGDATRWPSWSASTGRITARPPVTARSRSTSRWWRAPISR